MQPAKSSFWRTLIQQIRRLVGLDMPVTSHFVEQPIIIDYDFGAKRGPSAPDQLVATAPSIAVVADGAHEGALMPGRTDLLLASRLASVARLNTPAARKIERPRGGPTNRPAKLPHEPVKARKAEAWVLARSLSCRTAPAAKVVQLSASRRPRGTLITCLSLAA